MEFGGYRDEFGRVVKRTKQTHPYSYDGFVVYRGGDNSESNWSFYSDRLIQEDYKKYTRLSEKHFGDCGQYFYERNPKEIEEFLSDWIGRKGKLILVMEYCNMSSGYPTWRFEFKTEEDDSK